MSEPITELEQAWETAIDEALLQRIELQRALHAADTFKATLRKAVGQVVTVLRRGGTVFTCGNGGSAADANHLAAELAVRFSRDRSALAALSLCANPSLLTAVANDLAFEAIFSRQVEALGHPGDLLVAFSTSGGSPNILQALRAARQRGLETLGLTGAAHPAKFAELCSILLVVPSAETALVQEGHLTTYHLLCDLVERSMCCPDRATRACSCDSRKES
ncbi:MAG: hypothetical protein A2284_06630 [Deltaproteobacteria bacterium RIFOXYA12_FULL_61_11]|nr:MAG: hypothetical protein A2284_06630 [Deltaproteobacteria bacterium RIFOXYA12_FULL_61_11]